MKRRYKTGDWFRIRLGEERDVVGIITHGCRSRLFGYFFPVDASQLTTHEDLKALRPQDALTCSLFGGAGLEDAHWKIVATSLPFDPDVWPFPQFVSRGAFGRTWTRRTYDPDTLQVVRTQSIDAASAAALPDARFATPYELEELLRVRLSDRSADAVRRVCEVRSPVEIDRLTPGARIGFSTQLLQRDLDVLAAFLRAYPDTELRVHGFPDGFDAALLAGFSHLRRLVLDTRHVRNAQALSLLAELQSLQLGRVDLCLAFLSALPRLRVLHLRGTRANLDPVLAHGGLEDLALYDTQPLDVRALACAPRLTRLRLGHGAYVFDAAVFPVLAQLELRALPWKALPDLGAMAHLRSLRIIAMPQLGIRELSRLRGCRNLRSLAIDVGSRSISREIYRMMLATKGPLADAAPATEVPS